MGVRVQEEAMETQMLNEMRVSPRIPEPEEDISRNEENKSQSVDLVSSISLYGFTVQLTSIMWVVKVPWVFMRCCVRQRNFRPTQLLQCANIGD